MTVDMAQSGAPAEGGTAAQLQSLGQQTVLAASRVSSVYLDDPQSFTTYRDRLRREHDASVSHDCNGALNPEQNNSVKR